MSRHTDFIRHEIKEYGEVHLTIPKGDLNEVVNIAKASKVTLTTSNQTTETVKINEIVNIAKASKATLTTSNQTTETVKIIVRK